MVVSLEKMSYRDSQSTLFRCFTDDRFYVPLISHTVDLPNILFFTIYPV